MGLVLYLVLDFLSKLVNTPIFSLFWPSCSLQKTGLFPQDRVDCGFIITCVGFGSALAKVAANREFPMELRQISFPNLLSVMHVLTSIFSFSAIKHSAFPCPAVSSFWICQSLPFFASLLWFWIYFRVSFLNIFSIRFRWVGIRLHRNWHPWPSLWVRSDWVCFLVASSTEFSKGIQFSF